MVKLWVHWCGVLNRDPLKMFVFPFQKVTLRQFNLQVDPAHPVITPRHPSHPEFLHCLQRELRLQLQAVCNYPFSAGEPIWPRWRSTRKALSNNGGSERIMGTPGTHRTTAAWRLQREGVTLTANLYQAALCCNTSAPWLKSKSC